MKIKDNHKVKTSEMMDNLKKTFKVYSYWNDDELDRYFPTPKKDTTRDFADTQESDNKNKSRDDMEGQPLMTLREYILAFEQYFKETGKYLDEEGWTIFQDRLPSGGVACGLWSSGSSKVRFFWDDPDRRTSGYGARMAIPLSTSPLVPSDLENRVKSLEEDMDKIKKFLII